MIQTFDVATLTDKLQIYLSAHPIFADKQAEVSITNLTVWYSNRKLLGPKRQASRQVTSCPGLAHSTKKYSSYIFCKEEKAKVVNKLVGHFDSLGEAYNAAKDRASIRDGLKPSKKLAARKPSIVKLYAKQVSSSFRKKSSAHKQISSHDNISHILLRIKSEAFATLKHSERVDLVYEIIFDYFSYETETFNSGWDGMKGVSTVGVTVRSLPHFKQIVRSLPFQIQLDLQPRLNNKKPNVISHRRINSIANGRYFYGEETLSRRLVLDEYNLNSRLAVRDESVLNRVCYLKHVFRAGQIENLAMEHLRNHISVRAIDAHQTKQSKLDSKQQPIESLDTNEIFGRQIQISGELEECTIRIQRIYRINFFQKFERIHFKSHHSAIILQCFFRHLHDRKVVAELREKISTSPGLIQRNWRGWNGRCAYFKRRSNCLTLTRIVQPLFRGYQCRAHLNWVREHWCVGIKITMVAGIYLARKKVSMIRQEQISLLKIKMAIVLQCLVRKRLSTCFVKKLSHHVHVLVPSSIRIQARYRTFIAQRDLTKFQTIATAATTIQSFYRGLKLKILMKPWFVMIREQQCIILLQSQFRGFLDRQRVQYVRRVKFITKLRHEYASQIQSTFRGFYQRKLLTSRKALWWSSIAIQKSYRRMKERLKVNELRSKKKYLEKVANALTIQRFYRGHCGKREARHVMSNIISKRLYASRIIMRSWLRYKRQIYFQNLRDAWIENLYVCALNSAESKRKEASKDLRSISNEILSLTKTVTKLHQKKKAISAFIDHSLSQIGDLDAEVQKAHENKEENWLKYFCDERSSLESRIMFARCEETLCSKSLEVNKVS